MSGGTDWREKARQDLIAGINAWRRMTRINPPRLIDWRQRHTALSPIHDGVALDPNLSPQRADAIRWITPLTQFEMGKDMPVLVSSRPRSSLSQMANSSEWHLVIMTMMIFAYLGSRVLSLIMTQFG